MRRILSESVRPKTLHGAELCRAANPVDQSCDSQRSARDVVSEYRRPAIGAEIVARIAADSYRRQTVDQVGPDPPIIGEGSAATGDCQPIEVAEAGANYHLGIIVTKVRSKSHGRIDAHASAWHPDQRAPRHREPVDPVVRRDSKSDAEGQRDRPLVVIDVRRVEGRLSHRRC